MVFAIYPIELCSVCSFSFFLFHGVYYYYTFGIVGYNNNNNNNNNKKKKNGKTKNAKVDDKNDVLL